MHVVRKDLLEGLEILNKAIRAKNSKLLLDCDGNKMRMVINNFSSQAEYTLPASGVIRICIDSIVLENFIRNITSETVEFTINANNSAIKVSGNDNILSLASVPEYSEMEAPNIQPQISITSDELSVLLKNVIPFAGKGTGVELEFDDGILNTSATDMHDFIMCKTLTEDYLEPITAYVLPEDLEIVMRIVKNFELAVEITIGNKNIKWACGNSIIITRNSSIIFPDKEKLDCINFKFYINMYREDLLEAVKQVASLITKGEGSMKITFYTESIIVEASTQNEYIKYTLLTEHNMPVNSVLFVHPESLLLALNIIKDSEFKILLDEKMGILKMQSENLVIINALMRR